MRVAVTLSPRLSGTLRGAPSGVAQHVALLPVVRELARSRTTAVEVVRLPGGATVVRKRWTWPTAGDRAKGAFRTTVAAPSPARREWDAMRRLRALPSGVFAPEPLARVEVRALGVLRSCTLLVEEIAGATDLATFLRRTPDAARRCAVLADLGRRTRDMHAAGLLDREHHPRNVLVDGSRTWKVDCWKQRVRRAPRSPGDAIEDLAAIDVALVRFASGPERDAFLGAACGGAPDDDLRARLDRARERIEPREARRLPE